MSEIVKRDFNQDEVNLIKRTIAKGATDDELKLFLMQVQRTGLDPFSKQIYFIKRKVWNPEKRDHDEVGTIQTGIDGFRVIAERKGNYAPGKEPKYEYETDGFLKSATVTIIKVVEGKPYEVGATAFYKEYVQMTKDKKTEKLIPSGLWSKMPHVMLAKCAEALALRKAFPQDLSGIYTHEEMAQADKDSVEGIEVKDAPQTITTEQAEELRGLIAETKADINKFFAAMKCTNFGDMTVEQYNTGKAQLLTKKTKMEKK